MNIELSYFKDVCKVQKNYIDGKIDKKQYELQSQQLDEDYKKSLERRVVFLQDDMVNSIATKELVNILKRQNKHSRLQ
jgi:hypothetical protein